MTTDDHAPAASDGWLSTEDHTPAPAYNAAQRGAKAKGTPQDDHSFMGTIVRDLAGLPSGVMAFVRHPIDSAKAAVGQMDLDHPENSSGILGLPDTLYREWQAGHPGEAMAHLAETAAPLAHDLGPAAADLATTTAENVPRLAKATAAGTAAGLKAAPIIGKPIRAGLSAFAKSMADSGTAAAATEDTTLLDGVAQGFKYKDFASAPPDIQAQVRDLAGRLKQTNQAPPPGPRPAWRDNFRPTPPPAAAITPDEVTPPTARPAGLLPAAPSRVIDLPAPSFDPANDSSSVRSVTPGRGLARDPRTGRMMRVYSGSDKGLTPASAPSEEVQPPPELLNRLNATPDEPQVATPVANDTGIAQTGPVTPPPEQLQQLNAGASNGRTNGRMSRAQQVANDQYTAARRSKSAEEMAQFITRDPKQAQGIIDLLEHSEELPENPTQADLDRVQASRDQNWTMLKRLMKEDQLGKIDQAGGPVSQSDVMNLKNASTPDPATRRIAVKRVQEILQQKAAASAPAPKRTGMGAMKRYNGSYNPAALTDEQIAALNR